MAEVSLYGGMTPGFPSEADGETTRVLGTVAYSDVDTFIMALEWYAPTTLPAFADLGLWTMTGDDPNAGTGTRVELLTYTIGSMTTGTWNRLTLPSPRAWAANIPMLAQIHTDGHYVFSNPDTFPFASGDGTLHAYGEAEGGNGRWSNGAGNSTMAANNHPGGSGYNFFVNFITDVDGGPVSAEIGQVVETGTVFGITKRKIFTLGLVTETGTVFGITKAKSKVLSQVTETGLILPPSFVKSKTLNQVTESGIVLPPGYVKAKDISQVIETGTVLPIIDIVSAVIGQVVEAGTVFGVTKAKAKDISQVTETGTVFGITRAKSKTIGQVTETGTALPVTNASTIVREIAQIIEFGVPGRLGPTPEVDTEIFITPGYTVINL